MMVFIFSWSSCKAQVNVTFGLFLSPMLKSSHGQWRPAHENGQLSLPALIKQFPQLVKISKLLRFIQLWEWVMLSLAACGQDD